MATKKPASKASKAKTVDKKTADKKATAKPAARKASAPAKAKPSATKASAPKVVSKPVEKPAPAKATAAAKPVATAAKPAAAPAKAAPAKAAAPAEPVAPPAPRVRDRLPPSGTAEVVATGVVTRPHAPITAQPPGFGEGEEGDADSSLLAGPRNVQPYIVKRGEQYMNKEQLEHFRQILFTWKRDLMEEVDRTVSHMKDEAANFPDPNDRATQEEEFSLELRTRDRERKLIRKIEEALKRIEDGSYGYCLETGEEIGIKRLEARPVATLSIEAQERRERRERQYGDRDDRYR
jgi:DnaK suppressor protein